MRGFLWARVDLNHRRLLQAQRLHQLIEPGVLPERVGGRIRSEEGKTPRILGVRPVQVLERPVQLAELSVHDRDLPEQRTLFLDLLQRLERLVPLPRPPRRTIYNNLWITSS